MTGGDYIPDDLDLEGPVGRCNPEWDPGAEWWELWLWLGAPPGLDVPADEKPQGHQFWEPFEQP